MKPSVRFLSVAVIALVAMACAGPARAALVSYYPLDGNLLDTVGGRDGTAILGPLSYGGGHNGGQAVDLNGSNQYAVLGTSGDFGLGGNFTVSVFINKDIDTGSDRTILGNDGGSTNNTLHLVVRDFAGADKAHLGFYANDQAGNATLPTGAWTHVAYQFNNGTQSIYVNGALDASSGGHSAFAGTANGLLLGRWGGGNYFDGRIDNLAFYNEPLAHNQIAHLAAGGDPTALPVAAAKINWDFSAANPLQGWTVLSGEAFFRPDEGGGITAGLNGGFAHDPAHTNFVIASPTFYLNGDTIDGINVIQADFRGGMGDQNGNIANYDEPADAINYNGGTSNSLGVKALGIYDVNTGKYLGYLLDPGDGDTNGTIVSLTPMDLGLLGVPNNTALQLHFFDTDQGSWGWTQLNSVMIGGLEGTPGGGRNAIPEPATGLLALGSIALLGLRRRRAA